MFESNQLWSSILRIISNIERYLLFSEKFKLCRLVIVFHSFYYFYLVPLRAMLASLGPERPRQLFLLTFCSIYGRKKAFFRVYFCCWYLTSAWLGRAKLSTRQCYNARPEGIISWSALKMFRLGHWLSTLTQGDNIWTYVVKNKTLAGSCVFVYL